MRLGDVAISQRCGGAPVKREREDEFGQKYKLVCKCGLETNWHTCWQYADIALGQVHEYERRKMPKFKVGVEKRMYATGTVTVDCDDADQAAEMVQRQINSGALQTTAVEWSEPKYEDFTFETTGDVE